MNQISCGFIAAALLDKYAFASFGGVFIEKNIQLLDSQKTVNLGPIVAHCQPCTEA